MPLGHTAALAKHSESELFCSRDCEGNVANLCLGQRVQRIHHALEARLLFRLNGDENFVFLRFNVTLPSS